MFHKAGGRRIKVRLPTPKTVSPHFSITNTLSVCSLLLTIERIRTHLVIVAEKESEAASGVKKQSASTRPQADRHHSSHRDARRHLWRGAITLT